MANEFAGKNATIVGGSSGIGRAMAQILLSGGGLSEKASWITGALWDADGGVMAGRNQYSG